jgi:hypothetical protein
MGRHAYMWTPERLALLKHGRETGVRHAITVAKINELPGPFVSGDQAAWRAQDQGWKSQHHPWTDERKDLLRLEWPGGKTTRQIHAAINELPGPQVTLTAVQKRANSEGLRRPQKDRKPRAGGYLHPLREPKQSVVEMPPMRGMRDRDGFFSIARPWLVADDIMSSTALADWDTVMEWAWDRKMPLPPDANKTQLLRIINQQRVAYALPPFHCEPRDLVQSHPTRTAPRLVHSNHP